MTYWYRYDEDWGPAEAKFSWHRPELRLEILLTRYDIERETEHHVWIGSRKIGKAWRKQFACPTVEAALESFKRRKQHQQAYAEKHLKTSIEALRLITKNKYPKSIPERSSSLW